MTTTIQEYKSKDLSFYDDIALSEQWNTFERVAVLFGINPNKFHSKTDIRMSNIVRDVYINFNSDVSILPNDYNYVSEEIKKIFTASFYKAYRILNNYTLSHQTVVLKDGNSYDRSHPYVTIIDAYAKYLIDKKHPRHKKFQIAKMIREVQIKKDPDFPHSTGTIERNFNMNT